MSDSEAESRYSARGASASKVEVHRAIASVDKGLFPSAFCKILPDVLGGDEAWCNLIHADGAGTKAALAYMYWRETGDLGVWRGIAQDAVVMNLDDLCCAGARGPYLLSSTLGRNKYRIPGEVVAALIEGTQAFASEMESWGVKIYPGGGETADLGDLIQTLVVDSTMSARMPRSGVVSNHRIRPGDSIVAFASYGTCSYEKSENSGIGSNGLTSARHDLLDKAYAGLYPETYDHQVDASLVYSGRLKLTSDLNLILAEELGLEPLALRQNLDFGRWLLSPTRTYAPLILAMLEELGVEALHGMIHCSGGGQTKVRHFVRGMRVVKDRMMEIPPLFALIQRLSGSTWEEMYRVFNMGHRLEVYVSETHVEKVMGLGKHFGIECRVAGRVEAGSEGLSLLGPEGWIQYQD